MRLGLYNASTTLMWDSGDTVGFTYFWTGSRKRRSTVEEENKLARPLHKSKSINYEYIHFNAEHFILRRM